MKTARITIDWKFILMTVSPFWQTEYYNADNTKIKKIILFNISTILTTQIHIHFDYFDSFIFKHKLSIFWMQRPPVRLKTLPHALMPPSKVWRANAITSVRELKRLTLNQNYRSVNPKIDSAWVIRCAHLVVQLQIWSCAALDSPVGLLTFASSSFTTNIRRNFSNLFRRKIAFIGQRLISLRTLFLPNTNTIKSSSFLTLVDLRVVRAF